MSQRSLEDIFDSIHGENAFVPISPRREREGTDAMQGGGKEEFQPTKTDVNKLIQKLKCIQHGYQPKQMRMLLVSDSKFMRKIERTTDAKQLQDCVRAAAQRMRLVLPAPTQHDGKNQVQQQSNKNPSSSTANQHNLPAESLHPPAGQGKGKGKNDNSTQPKAKGKGKTVDKGKGKGKGNYANQQAATSSNPQSDGKGKGKSKHSTMPRSFQLDPEAWNVLPLPEFSPTQGGVYMCEKAEQAKRIAELGVGKPFPIGILSPFSLDIGVKKPDIIHVEVMRQAGGISHKITMQAFLRQITHVDAVYRKTAPVVNIQKPPNARSSVCYLTFTDEGACVQTKIEMQQKRIPAAKMWIQSLIQQGRGLEIMDVWNLQETAFDGNHRTYQISVRVPSDQVEAFLAISGPGKLQVNVPGALRGNLRHLWLKAEGKPMNEEQVQGILDANRSLHLGAFCIRGTWAIRTLTQNFDELKSRMGRNEEPAYFISNVSPEMEHENMIELLKQLKWKATIQKGERRWKGAGYTWLVRSADEPSVWQLLMNFGYERRTLRIQDGRKPKIVQAMPVPDNSIVEFPTWGSQCRAGRQIAKQIMQPQPTFAEIVSTPHRKRPKRDDQMDAQSPWTDDEKLPDSDAQKTSHAA